MLNFRLSLQYIITPASEYILLRKSKLLIKSTIKQVAFSRMGDFGCLANEFLPPVKEPGHAKNLCNRSSKDNFSF